MQCSIVPIVSTRRVFENSPKGWQPATAMLETSLDWHLFRGMGRSMVSPKQDSRVAKLTNVCFLRRPCGYLAGACEIHLRDEDARIDAISAEPDIGLASITE